jgi:hypothetical protein
MNLNRRDAVSTLVGDRRGRRLALVGKMVFVFEQRCVGVFSAKKFPLARAMRADDALPSSWQ